MLAGAISSNFRWLAVQLTLDPTVKSLKFVTSLPVGDEEVEVGMLVVERDEGSVAYDIVDERPHRDIDTEGLLLIALGKHGITRVEVDGPLIGSEPLAGNCKRIWKHRDVDVSQDVQERIDSVLTARRLSVRDLGRAIRLRNAMTTVSALICRRVLYTELSTDFSPASWVARRSDRADGASPSAARETLTETVRMVSGDTKR
jgi:hypothetical protein